MLVDCTGPLSPARLSPKEGRGGQALGIAQRILRESGEGMQVKGMSGPMRRWITGEVLSHARRECWESMQDNRAIVQYNPLHKKACIEWQGIPMIYRHTFRGFVEVALTLF